MIRIVWGLPDTMLHAGTRANFLSTFSCNIGVSEWEREKTKAERKCSLLREKRGNFSGGGMKIVPKWKKKKLQISSAPNHTISSSNTSMTHVLFNYLPIWVSTENKFYHLDDGNIFNVSEFHKKNEFHTKTAEWLITIKCVENNERKSRAIQNN